MVAAFFVLSRILASPFGAVIEAMRENETRAAACGYNVRAHELVAFVLSGAFCGLAGALARVASVHRADRNSAFRHSGVVVMIALLGGMGTFFGPFDRRRGLFLLFDDVVSLWTVHWQLVVGAVFMIFVLFFPGGIWGTLISRGKRDSDESASSEVILRTEGVGKKFGGFVALNNVSVSSPKVRSRRSSARTAPARARSST